MSKTICALCGEAKSLVKGEVCAMCANDVRLLGSTAAYFAPEAHRLSMAEVPDWAREHEQAQESGEVFAEEYRGSHL